MSKFVGGPLKRIAIMILEEDHRKLKALYPKGGYNRVIRKLVNNHVRERLSLLVDEVNDGGNTGRPVLEGPEADDEGGSTGGGPAAA